MPRGAKKGKKHRQYKEGIYSEDVLRDKTYKKNDKVYFLLFPFSEPNNIKIFSGTIL